MALANLLSTPVPLFGMALVLMSLLQSTLAQTDLDNDSGVFSALPTAAVFTDLGPSLTAVPTESSPTDNAYSSYLGAVASELALESSLASEMASETAWPTDSLPTLMPEPAGDDDDDNDDHSTSRLVNLYFLLLLILVAALIIGFFAYQRRKKRRTIQQRRRGNDALANDPSSWHRWRRQRHDHSGEALDERGEAPPPYMPDEPERAALRGHGDTPTSNIELRNVASRDHMRKPPGYIEAVTEVPLGEGTNETEHSQSSTRSS